MDYTLPFGMGLVSDIAIMVGTDSKYKAQLVLDAQRHSTEMSKY